MPGVKQAAVATAIPLRGWSDGMPFRLPEKPNEIVGTGFTIVTPGYFQALGLRVAAGRLLDDRDRQGTLPVAVASGWFARGAGDTGVLIKSIQRAVLRANENQVLDRSTTVAQLKAESMAGRRMPTMLREAFALLAMLRACAGIYGVRSFVTANRTQEIGIRAALGASRSDLVRMVPGGGATPVMTAVSASPRRDRPAPSRRRSSSPCGR